MGTFSLQPMRMIHRRLSSSSVARTPLFTDWKHPACEIRFTNDVITTNTRDAFI